MLWVEFVDIDFWYDWDRVWFRYGLVFEVVNDEFFIGRMKLEVWRECSVGIYVYGFGVGLVFGVFKVYEMLESWEGWGLYFWVFCCLVCVIWFLLVGILWFK